MGFPQQLKSLGYLCGLVSEKGPNSEDLNRTVDLLAGLGAERPETGMVAAEAQWRMPEVTAPCQVGLRASVWVCVAPFIRHFPT